MKLTFPDGTAREVASGTTGRDLAGLIARSLARKAVAFSLDGQLHDLDDAIARDGAVRIITRDDPEALELIRHDCAHVLAEAVQELFPGVQVTIGPVIEDGFYYDFKRDDPFTPADFPAIEKKMREIIARDAPFTKAVWRREDARALFADKGEHFKCALIDAIPPDQPVLIYRQGDWFDLCRGPHMPSTGKIGPAFKLMKVAGAYWRGDARNPMLTRIYGTAWATPQDLDAYLHRLEEAEKRDHRRLGREMDLFHFQDDAPGTVFWHPKGWHMFQTLIGYMRRRQDECGYMEVNSPQLLDRSLWIDSGHWEKYREHMFVSETEDKRIYALKPMNCPGHVQIFKHGLRSYRELPVRIAEFGAVHRYEPSGALHGLMRVRAFTQDDAHIFCSEEQIADMCLEINDLMLSIYADFGFRDIDIKLATRPEKRVGSDALWDRAETAMRDVLAVLETRDSGQNRLTTAVIEGEGAFYGPKFEYHLRDAIGRTWQCGTTQVDFNLPGRLGAVYIGADGEKKTPVMIHRAMFGSLERFLGILIENCAGRVPLWLAPVQAMICTITGRADEYALELRSRLRQAGLRAEADLRNEKIGYKIREHSHAKLPVIAVVGAQEMAAQTVNLRRLGQAGQESLTVAEAIATLTRQSRPPNLMPDREAASVR